jgi:tetratricopeptide (TPR) repeat protein
MAYDPYSLCPCGSGKKLKFCCAAIADEMERIQRLIDDNQMRAALKQLEALDKKHPSNEWITTTRALILLESREAAAARDLLRPWLAAHPDNDFATVLYALAVLQAEGYDAAKKAIQRAYQKGAKKYPSLVSSLAETTAVVMLARNEVMAARETLSLALRFAGDAQRQDIFLRLLELDNDQGFYYPLRGVHPLPAVQLAEEFDKDHKRALKLAAIGCWDQAAETFEALSQKLPDVGELLQSAGLCWACDGDGKRAAHDLHQAAKRLGDFALAVECETLAQIFDLENTDQTRDLLAHDAEVTSVSRLLSVLDEQPRLVRIPVPQPSPGQTLTPSALYQILDRERPAEQNAAQVSLDALPNVLAQIVLYDAAESQQPRLVISGVAGSSFDTALEIVKAAAGELAVWSTEPPEAVDETPLELELFDWNWSLPKLPLGKRHALEREQWQRVLERWLDQQQAALGGKSPKDAAGDPALRVPATAAVYVLDAVCQNRRHRLDLPGMLSRLGLEPLPPLTLAADVGPNALSLMQLHRLPPASLTDAQLSAVVNRAMLAYYDAFLEPVLQEALARPNLVPDHDLPRIYQTLVELTGQHGDLPNALHWIETARQKVFGPTAKFEDQWRWDLRELMLRLTDPGDPGLKGILRKFTQFYGPKLPQLRSYLGVILEEAGVESPWNSVLAPEMAASGGVWTPESEAAAPAGKLWLPGQ